MNKKMGKEAYGIYKLFKFDLGDSGSKAAKPNNIQTIIDICKEKNPKRVLELGGGNGTITYALMKNSGAVVDVYEPLDFCQERLKKNLKGYEDRYNLVGSYKELPPHREYELIIIDGGNYAETGIPNVVTNFLKYLNSFDTIFIEGRRPDQRAEVRKVFSERGLYRVIIHSDSYYEGNKYTGGQEVRFYPNKLWIFNYLNHLFWELLIDINKLKNEYLDAARRGALLKFTRIRKMLK